MNLPFKKTRSGEAGVFLGAWETQAFSASFTRSGVKGM